MKKLILLFCPGRARFSDECRDSVLINAASRTTLSWAHKQIWKTSEQNEILPQREAQVFSWNTKSINMKSSSVKDTTS